MLKLSQVYLKLIEEFCYLFAHLFTPGT